MDMQGLLARAKNLLQQGTDITPPDIDVSICEGLFAQSPPIETSNSQLHDAICNAYPIEQIIHQYDSELTDNEADNLTQLFAWAAQSLVHWSGEDDPDGRRLSLVLAIAMLARISLTQLWQITPNPKNSELIRKLDQYLNNIKVEVVIPHSESIENREFIVAFQKADKIGNWIALEDKLLSFIHDIANYNIEIISKFMFDIAPNFLVKCADRITSTLKSYILLKGLSLEQAIALSAKTSSNYVRFIMLLSLKKGYAYLEEEMTSKTHSSLTEIWLSQSENQKIWQEWMGIFNKYPVRFPRLQKSLGFALAKMPDAALEAYVDAISLGGDTGRKEVTICLTEFRQTATMKKRKYLWKLAYERWENWLNEYDNHIMGFCKSQLDFAVIGHVVEGMTTQQCGEELYSLLSQIKIIETAWYKDISRLQSAHNLLLTKMHFIATGDIRRNTTNVWLDNKLCVPEEIISNDYHAMRIGAHNFHKR